MNNRHGDGSNKHRTETEEGGERHCGQRRRLKNLCKQGWDKQQARVLSAGSSKMTARYVGSRLTWNMSFARERETRDAAAWNAEHMLGDFWKAQVNCKFMCNVSKATQGALLSGLRAVAGQNGSFTENWLLSHGSVSEQIGASTPCTDEEDLGQSAKKKTIF